MIPENLIIRPFRIEDCGQALGIASDLGLSPWSLEDYRDELKHPESEMLAAAAGSKLAGFIIGRRVPGSRPSGGLDAEIYNIGVSERAQRSGVGSMLIYRFIEKCRNAGVKDVWLDVRSANAKAILFYNKIGFEKFDVRRNFYRDPTDDGIVMMLNLDEVFVNFP